MAWLPVTARAALVRNQGTHTDAGGADLVRSEYMVMFPWSLDVILSGFICPLPFSRRKMLDHSHVHASKERPRFLIPLALLREST